MVVEVFLSRPSSAVAARRPEHMESRELSDLLREAAGRPVVRTSVCVPVLHCVACVSELVDWAGC